MLNKDVCLVTGGRDFTDEDFVFATLDAVHASTGFKILVHGNARGLDRTADRWALDRGGVTIRRYAISPEEWERQGRSAGHRRNRQMYDENEPGIVVVFPGGRGTAHAAGIAEGIKERHPELLLVRADHVYEAPPAPKLINVHIDPKGYRTDRRFRSIGRDGPFGNPFVIGKDGDRDQVIQKYREWLVSQPDLVARIRRDLVDAILGCYCVPQACHGNVILEVLDGKWPPAEVTSRPGKWWGMTTPEGSCRCQGFYQPPDCPIHCGVLAYCDGSNSLKDGSAGLGVVLFYRDGRTIQIADACGPGSNNHAELSAIHRALKEVTPTHPLLIRTDSAWSIGALTSNWAITKNLELLGKIRASMVGRQVTFEHVKGHAGEPGNEAADRLAHEGRMKDQLHAEFAKICAADARDIAEWNPEGVRSNLEFRRSLDLEMCHPAAIDGMVLIQVLGKRYEEGEHVRLAQLAQKRTRKE